MNENDPSVLRNLPDPNYKPDYVPPPSFEPESVSVLRNKPEKVQPPTPPVPLGEVMPGAQNDVDPPPSVLGTSFGPVAPEHVEPSEEHETQSSDDEPQTHTTKRHTTTQHRRR